MVCSAASKPFTAIAHFLPVFLAVCCNLLLLVPYLSQQLDPSAMASVWGGQAPFIPDEVFTDIAFLQAVSKLDLLPLALLVPITLFVRFPPSGRSNTFHPHFFIYIVPVATLGGIYLIFLQSPDLFLLLAFSLLWVLILDLYFSAKGTIYSEQSRFSFHVFGLLVGTGAILCFIWPAFMSMFMGPLPMVLLFTSLLLLIVIILAALPKFLSWVAVAVFAFFIWNGSFGVRPVHLLTDGSNELVTVDSFVTNWLESRRDEIAAYDGTYPVFFVTADGGGIRAAYWSATLLGAINDDYPNFIRHTITMSGVSGGAVGVSIFAALAAAEINQSYQATAARVLDKDFLSAPLGYLLWRDFWTSTACYGKYQLATCSETVDDRISILETALARSFLMQTGSKVFTEPITGLWPEEGKSGYPALLLNTTLEGTGRLRVITPLRIDQEEQGGPMHLQASGVLERLPEDVGMSLATAAFLSARFPVISPNGLIPLADGKFEELVDGGYFDNSGAAGAQLILDAFAEVAGNMSPPLEIKPYALFITNDTNRDEMFPRLTGAGSCDYLIDPVTQARTRLLSTPLRTLDGIRQYSAEVHRYTLAQKISSTLGGEVLKLGLFRCPGDAPFPLGWTLSGRVRKEIDDKIERFRANSAEHKKLGAILSPGS
jgi:hypothetical protein